ncbi:HD-GYP domain-containing protein [Lederbergia panacisoli]|uniref:HD-GYP domain-containing protein n=1 Tax=Lederbergia panacisoli TaxID=1255251 RepID=UPI00214BCF42|nr:HD-GYP domain-containing protein [Lederbergia panacisoli]MCR2822642.1 HD-GYP domain-containing protein [Lederbergia panacisoli]
MKVKVEELIEGCILHKDVMGKTNNPIIPADTVLTKRHLLVLKSFLIKEVEIENKLKNGELFRGVGESESSSQMKSPQTLSFLDYYSRAVDQYKKEFLSWQSGMGINIANIRTFLIPLFDKAQENKNWIRKIHRFSNKEEYFYHHPIAVAMIASFIAKGLGYDNGQCLQIALAGCLADCGMAKINESTFMNTRSLNEKDWNEIKKHPIHSYQMVKDISLLKPETKIAILQHHERLDGSGYPIGEIGSRVQMHSQILAIADIFHAMTADRPYKSMKSPFKALQEMEEDQFGKLHISILKVLISAIASLPVGTTIKLSDDQLGKVIFVKQDALLRPLVKIVDTGEILDLEKHRNIYIDSIIGN